MKKRGAKILYTNEADRKQARLESKRKWRLKNKNKILQYNKEYMSKNKLSKKVSKFITDGFGSTWSKKCPSCGKNTMQVVRPGKVQCKKCS